MRIRKLIEYEMQNGKRRLGSSDAQRLGKVIVQEFKVQKNKPGRLHRRGDYSY